MSRKLQVFLCHASEDKPVVRGLYERLKSEDWIDPWLDSEKLLAGQDWDLEIEKTIHNADAIIICLSKRSTNKEGYVQREIKRALNISEEKPEGVIHLIPLRLDDCDMPSSLKRLHWINYYEDEFYENLRKSLHERMKQIEGDLRKKSDFEFVCCFCGKAIDIDKDGGKVFVDRSAIRKAKKISEEIESTGLKSADNIDIMSSTAYWCISHYSCDTNESPAYQIDLTQIKTAKQVIEWTSHLMEKTWITHTNWHDFISLLTEQIKN
jgi:hypothetical protein